MSNTIELENAQEQFFVHVSNMIGVLSDYPAHGDVRLLKKELESFMPKVDELAQLESQGALRAHNKARMEVLNNEVV
jgi:hypothetical protein